MSFAKEKIFITGGGGFVGSHLAEAELKKGNQVVALDLANDEKVKHLLNNPDFEYISADMLNRELIEKYVKWADLIYHFGAIANVQIYCKDPVRVIETNIKSLQIVLELAYQYKKKIIFSSSSETYGKNPKVPWSEEDDRVLGSTNKHRWCYSTSKAMGEHYFFAYADKGLKMAICRFFNFYGPRLDFIGQGRVVTCFLEKFLNNKPVEVVKPGTQTRCFTYIDDGIDGILRIAHRPEAEGKVFNIGTDKETSMIELAEMMKKVGNFSSDIAFIEPDQIYEKGYEDIPRRVPDITRIKTVLDWEPKTSLENGLKITIDHYKELFGKTDISNP